MIEPVFSFKQGFFDTAKINKAVDQATRKAMSRSLAYIRTSARSSLRRRKRVSRPGQTPSVHSNDPNVSLKKILFAFDVRTKSGIVGSVGLNSSKARGNKPLPSVFESGGTLTLKEESYDGQAWRQTPLRRRRKPKPGMKKRTRKVRVSPRPFMVPALEKETAAGHVLSPWANAVTN